MRFSRRILRFLVLLLASSSTVLGQAPRLWLKFDGTTADSSSSGLVTAVTPNWTVVAGDYTTDRNGVASKALNFSGSRGLQVVTGAVNSNEALGLRTAAGTNTSFTLSAWVSFNSSGGSQGYSTIFGNQGTGAGTLHAGLNNNSTSAHFGFDGNDVNGATYAASNNVWYHYAFVYDAAEQTQRIFINGVPEVTRTAVDNTLKASDLLIANWNTTNNASNDLKGKLDDVAVYNVALAGDQIIALANGVAPGSLPAPGTYGAPKTPGYYVSSTGLWSVREIRSNPVNSSTIGGIGIGTLINAERILRAYTPGQAATLVSEYQTQVINLRDADSGTSHFFANDSAFGSNVAGTDDNYIVMIAKCGIRVSIEDDYTFGFRGDDGSHLRIIGQQFLSSTRVQTANPADPAHLGDGIYYTAGQGDTQTLGVVHLKPGDYNMELVYWEGTGSSSVEVFAARGARTSADTTNFKLVGDPAGPVQVVRDPDTLPHVTSFTGNGQNPYLYVHNGVPANFALAWTTNSSDVPGQTVSINQGIGSVAQNGSTVIASPAANTTYTITTVNGTDTESKTLNVRINTAPTINSFTSDKTRNIAGQPVALSWTVDGAATLTLNPGGIDVTGQTSATVNPTADTTYTLVATNPSGSVQRTVSVQAGVGPAINAFTVADPNPLYGAETTLSWDVTPAGTTTISIDNGVGTVGPTGTAPIVPLLTTTYTLSATNFYGTVTSTATVTQPTPIGVAAPGFTVRRVNSNTPFPYTAQGLGYLQSAVTLVGETSGGPHYASETSGTYSTINFADGTDGDFGGNSGFPGGGGDNFAMRITATLIVNTPGEYTFVLNSDDGARLRIDGQDVIVDDGTHTPASTSGKIVLTKPTATLELIYFDTTGGAEVELGWIRPNLQWTLLGTITPAAPNVLGKVMISEFMAENKNTLLDEDGATADWIEVWNSTASTVNLGGYYLTDDAAIPNKWAFPAWTLGPNQYLLVFASSKDRKPAQAVAGQDNPGTLAQPHLHTNFSLNKTTGHLALMKDNGAGGFTTLTVFDNYPAQKEDVSYGTSDAESYLGYMETPTPGQPNAASVHGFVEDTSFVDAGDNLTPRKRGRYTTPFSLAITTATPGATIRYTTNGSTPTRTNGTIYATPIPVTGTKVIRAIAYKAGWKATNVDTESYLFVNDIVNQTTTTATAIGFPTSPIAGRGQVVRYGLSLSNVTTAGGSLQSLKDALAAVPTVCMSTDIPNLMDPTTGIYANADKHGLFWERPASIEYINTAGTSEFQIDCGVRIRGGYSRSQTNPKHAFHLFFRGSLYDGDLKYRLFGTKGAAQFDQIDMRCEENYSWSFDGSGQNTLMREEWGRITQADMGQPNSRTGYFHLYINGIYWGIYNWEERTEADYGATYLGGEKENMDVVKSAGSSGGYNTEMTDGNFAAWENLYRQAIALKNDTVSEASRTARYMQMQGLNPDGSRNTSYPVLLDVDNLIDYNLVIFHDGSFDSPLSTFLVNASNNWFGVRDRAGTRGFSFYIHDNEHGMDSVTDGRAYNRVGPWGASGNNNWGQTQYNSRETITNTFYSKSNPQYLHEMLCYSAEYRQRFADRVQKHYFNGGALTTAKAVGRVNALATQVDTFIHAEAARWGSSSLNRNQWLNAKNTVLNFLNAGGAPQSGFTNFGAQTDGRNSLIITQLRGYQDPLGTSKALFPPATLSAPVFGGSFGGPVPSPYTLNITNPNGSGTIYYTVDGGDPRDIGGGVAAGALTAASPIPVTLNSTATVRARILNGASWSALTEASYLVGALASPTNLVVSKIHYNPAGSTNLEQFVEVMNIGAQTIDLTNVHFTLGITFHFPDGFTLASKGRALIVRDLAAFTAAYPNVPGSQIAGVFEDGTNLDTNGEQLQLVDQGGGIIRDFDYDDKAPWPVEPDGDGPSLVLIHPESNPDHTNAINWRASYSLDGSPGLDAYAEWAAANGVVDTMGNGDDDKDGIANLAEYALGLNPKVGSTAGLPTMAVQSIDVGGVVSDYLTLTYTRPVGRDGITYLSQASSDLSVPWSAATQVGLTVNNGNGTETLTFRHPNPKAGQAQQYLRLKITRTP